MNVCHGELLYKSLRRESFCYGPAHLSSFRSFGLFIRQNIWLLRIDGYMADWLASWSFLCRQCCVSFFFVNLGKVSPAILGERYSVTVPCQLMNRLGFLSSSGFITTTCSRCQKPPTLKEFIKKPLRSLLLCMLPILFPGQIFPKDQEAIFRSRLIP